MSNQLEHQSINSFWSFDNTYTQLPDFFWKKQIPTPVSTPSVVVYNHDFARELGLTDLPLDDLAHMLSGNTIPATAEPFAQAYAGHQFGHFTMLGDGRAILLGEQITPENQRYDVQFKGAGQTPFSRRGDGRAALGPMLREYVISEAMHALGIPTTRSLAVIATGETVYRDSPLPGAVLTRVASSHLRVGTFEYAANFGTQQQLKQLADYTLNRHFPELRDSQQPYLAMLKAIMERQAALVADWQRVGFIHGVMNTDNMAISGETIDYGPCAFMDTYHPNTVFSSIDRQGRYAYGNQPFMAQWNLARLTEALLPLLDSDPKKALQIGTEMVQQFPDRFEQHWLNRMQAKLGLFNTEPEDSMLVAQLLAWMQLHRRDFTLTFRQLSGKQAAQDTFFQYEGFKDWYQLWQARLSRQPESNDAVERRMNQHNPAVIPRNHQVEAALKAAAENGDLAPFTSLLAALKCPYSDNENQSAYRNPPPVEDENYRTFCGT